MSYAVLPEYGSAGKRGHMTRLQLAASAMIFLLILGAKAHAMSAYARNFDMKCGECHKQRIPELNDFGIAFYKNGFALPGAEKGKAPKPSSGEQAGTLSEPSDGQEKKSADASGAPDEKGEEKTPVPPPEVPLVIYQGQAGDGSVYFTDNPLSKRLEDSARKSRKIAARHSPERHPPQKEAAAPPQKPAVPEYRSYQECMERLLENAPPATTQQMMDLLMTAERACIKYTREKP